MIYLWGMALTFYTQSKKDYSPIWVRYRQHSIDAKARTTLYVETGRLKHNKILKHKATASSDAHQKKLISQKNKALDSVKQQIELLEIKILDSLNNRKETDVVNSKWLTRAVQPRLADKTFIENFKEFIDQKKGLKSKTIVNLKGIIKVLKAYEDDKNISLYLISINSEFKISFEDWADTKGYSKSTLKRYLAVIKTVCFHFEKQGEKISHYVKYLTQDIATQSKKQIFLTIDEIDTISNLKLKDEFLDNARDWLVLSFYLGQRHSDFMRATKKNIHKDGTIRLSQQKTDAKVQIPILPKTQEIINKYNGGFPKPLSVALYNQRIKEVCKLAGLNEIISTTGNKGKTNGNKSAEVKKPKYELVSSHIGRRSFVTHFYGKMKTPDIMQITGHKTEASFYTYLNEAREIDVKGVKKDMISAI